jgi:hypothetical protein
MLPTKRETRFQVVQVIQAPFRQVASGFDPRRSFKVLDCE